MPFIVDLALFCFWLVVSLLIFHLQFIFHELAHFRIGNTSDEVQWLVEIQGPFGMRIDKKQMISNDLELKELQAPYVGYSFLLNVFLILLQAAGTIYIFSISTQKWLMLFFFLFWIEYGFDLAVTILIGYWRLFTPEKTWLASKLAILAGTDVIAIAYLKSIEIPAKFVAILKNYNPDDYFAKIDQKIAEGSVKKLYSDNKFTVIT